MVVFQRLNTGSFLLGNCVHAVWGKYKRTAIQYTRKCEAEISCVKIHKKNHDTFILGNENSSCTQIILCGFLVDKIICLSVTIATDAENRSRF